MSEENQQNNTQQKRPSGRRRRRRPRRRGGPKGPPTQVQGYLWMRDSGSPLMVMAERNFVGRPFGPDGSA